MMKMNKWTQVELSICYGNNGNKLLLRVYTVSMLLLVTVCYYWLQYVTVGYSTLR